MPAFPELARVLGLVGRVEVFGQVETHEHGHADGNVGVAREIGVDLQGIAEQGHQVLEACIKHGLGKHHVNEVDGDVVAQDDFLHQAVHDPEHGDTELLAAEEVFLVELRDELVGPHDGTCHQLREEAHIEAEVKDIAYRRDAVAVHIHDVADGLEGVERDTHRQQDGVDVETVVACDLVACPRKHVEHTEVQARQVVDDISDEIGVFEIEQDGQVDDDAERQHEVTALFLLSCM